MKRCIAAVSVVIVMLLFSGCGKRLTAEEYKDEMQNRVRVYFSAQMAIVNDMNAFNEGGVVDSGGFKEHCKAFESAMKNFEKIKPPSKYEGKHARLIDALDNEREWMAAVRDLISSTTPEEAEKAEETIQKAASYSDSFPMQYFQLSSELAEEIGEDLYF